MPDRALRHAAANCTTSRVKEHEAQSLRADFRAVKPYIRATSKIYGTKTVNMGAKFRGRRARQSGVAAAMGAKARRLAP
jgi:hypothetical protein